MANKPQPQKSSKKLDMLYSLLVLALALMAILAIALSVCTLIQNNSKALNILSIASMIFSVASVVLFITVIVVDKPIKKIRAAAGNGESVTVDEMSGVQFEQHVAKMLINAGWEEVEITPATGDHGVDITAVYNGGKYAIQCKRYKSAVDTKAVQEVYTGKGVYDADHAIVITNSTFTRKAKEMAEKLDIELWDMGALEQIIARGR